MIKLDNIETYLNMLNELITLSKCEKRQVGCFIIKNNSIISSGINGTPSGYKNNNCEEFIFKCTNCNKEFTFDKKTVNEIITNETKLCHECNCGCSSIFTSTYLKECVVQSTDIVIHAEENAILKAVKNNIPLDGSEMIITTMPCIRCAKQIHAVGIRKVFYKDAYKNTDGIDLLRELNIEVIKI